MQKASDFRMCGTSSNSFVSFFSEIRCPEHFIHSGGLLIDLKRFDNGKTCLQHIKVHTKSLLEANGASLDGTDCSYIGNPTTPKEGGYVSMVMT